MKPEPNKYHYHRSKKQPERYHHDEVQGLTWKDGVALIIGFIIGLGVFITVVAMCAG